MRYKIKKIYKKEFPNKLKNIKNVPDVLYLVGNQNLLFEECFGIVGTRRISDYGIKNCEKITKEFVFRNIPVVSGMAIGTDTIAHKTVVKYEGKTIAVLGSGFGNVFPPQNKELFEKIIEIGGLVVTEFEYNVKPLKENFPKRNRIVTALSEGILVIEAGYRSGSTITAKNAIEQGKLVFALPGKLDSSVGIGVNNLIKKGAIFTTEINDILERYPQFKNRLRKECKEKNILSNAVKAEYKELYKFIEQGCNDLESILNETNLDLRNLLVTLTNMEIEGIVNLQDDGKYTIKN